MTIRSLLWVLNTEKTKVVRKKIVHAEKNVLKKSAKYPVLPERQDKT